MNRTSKRMPIDSRTTDPCFFASISSVKTNFLPEEYIKLLHASGYRHILVSAYDLHRMSTKALAETLAILEDARKQGTIVMLDSGNYESYWHRDNSWTQDKFHSILKESTFDLCMSYDGNQCKESVAAAVDDVCQRYERDDTAGYPATIVPIIHGGSHQLHEIAFEIVKRLKPLAIALPERELGDGILTRYNCLQRIRAELDRTKLNIPIHILGTGNPRSLMLLWQAGANSFDGLEWCQTTVDHGTGQLHHFQHRELFSEQLPLKEEFSYSIATLIHNLAFYSGFVSSLAAAETGQEAQALLSKYFPEKVLKLIRTDPQPGTNND